MSDLDSVVISKKADGSWQAQHVPSGKFAFGLTAMEAQEEMRLALGVKEDGTFDEPTTHHQFEGIGQEIAKFLEGEVSEALASHAGFARLDDYQEGVAHVRLGGGCKGCPSSVLTLVHGVKKQLQQKFGEEVVSEVVPSHG